MIIFILGIVIFIHILVIAKLIFFPYPELFIYPYLTSNGFKPYQQILDQHFPGLFFLPINFNNLGMTDPFIARIWLMGIIVITQLLLFLVSKELLKSSKKALLVNIFYLIWQPFFEGWVLWIDSFLPIFLLSAFYFLHQRKYLFSGLLLGIAIVFKQTIIPLGFILVLYIFIQRRTFKEVSYYLAGLLIPNILMLIYFLKIGVLWDFWYWNFVFNLTIYAKYGTKSAIEFGFISRILLIYSLSLLGFFYKSKRVVMLLLTFLLGSLISILDRADFIHLQPSLPFVSLAAILGITAIKNKKVLGVLIFFFLIITIWWQVIFYKGHISDKIFFFDNQIYSIVNKIKYYTNKGDKIFVYGAFPHLYQMSDTLPAGNIFVFQFPWFLRVAEDRILQGIIKDKPEIIVYDTSYKIEDLLLKDFSKNIYQYIENNYKKIDNVNATEILQRIKK